MPEKPFSHDSGGCASKVYCLGQEEAPDFMFGLFALWTFLVALSDVGCCSAGVAQVHMTGGARPGPGSGGPWGEDAGSKKFCRDTIW